MESHGLTESLRETLAVFDGGVEPRTTSEVAEALDLGRRSTYDRLDRLVEQGRLRTKKVGASARVWWRVPGDGSPTAEPDWPAAAESLVSDVLNRAEVGVFVLDENYDVVWLNDATERYFGIDRDRVIGRDKRDVVDQLIAPSVDDSEGFAERLLATYDGDTGEERFECRTTVGDGRTERWLEHRSNPIETGAYAGGRVELYFDVTERKRSEQAYIAQRDQFESLVGAVEEYAIFRLDPEGRVRTWNAGAERLKGYETDEVVGEHVSTFYTEADREAGVPEANLETAAENGWVEDEGWRVRADGTRFWANVSITSIRDDEGDLLGYAKVTRDMTERREFERELERERDLLERALDAIPAGVAVVDEEGDPLRMNEQARRYLGALDGPEPDPLPEATVFDEDGDPVPPGERPYDRARRTGETVGDWIGRFDLPGVGERWLSVNAVPLADADGDVERVVVSAEDITQLKEQARLLERSRDDLEHELNEVLDRVDDGFIALDDEWRFTYVNDQAADLLDRPQRALVGRNVWDEFPETADSRFRTEYERARETNESVSFEAYFSPLENWFDVTAYPSESGLSVYFRDVTERKARERGLERYETIVETVDDGIYALDDENRYVVVNDAFCEMVGYERDELLGAEASVLYDDEYAPVVEERAAAVAEGEREVATIEFELVRKDGSRVPVETRYEPLSQGDGYGRCGVVRDISERIERERELQRRIRQQQVVTDLGQHALGDRDLDSLMAEAAERVATTLATDYCEVLDLDADGEELLLRQGVGWEEGLVDSAAVSATDDDSQAAYTLRSGDPVVVEDLTTETRFGERDLLADHGVRSGISVVIGPPEDPWGILGTHDTEATAFSERDVNFVQSVATILATAINRHRYEDALVRQREQLAALNSLNEAVREITGAVLDQSTRDEIERTVCEHLAATDSYEFAWIGDVETGSQTVAVRTEAGAEGYLDDVTVSIDPDDERSQGPTGRAIRTGEVQTIQHIQTDPRYEPWREAADEHGFASSAAIPIGYQGTTYGVLNVYAGRPNAFEGQERTVLGQLGEVIGHAIAATDRKQALLSDEVVELEFGITDLFETLDVEDSPGGRFTFEHVVTLGHDEFLVYGEASAEAVPTLEALVDRLPHWAAVSFTDDEGDTRFELRMDEPPVLSTLASLGGSVERAAVEDGDYRMTLHLSPSADVRRVIDAVQDAYPSATMLRRQQVTKDGSQSRPTDALLSGLTDRQQTTLEAAYHAGFFEWPRDASGEDVAESLQVSPPTFHQHLRKAEGKVFGALFEAADG
ncbi:PAS domain S-box protein [Halosimplex sp. TS25]|uniref:PAS domain S-box protein n=1 Tax=Halosimplex rarum TaxID=3396619 RepID=UPI0039EB8022